MAVDTGTRGTIATDCACPLTAKKTEQGRSPVGMSCKVQSQGTVKPNRRPGGLKTLKKVRKGRFFEHFRAAAAVGLFSGETGFSREMLFLQPSVGLVKRN
jgi:hypothetical protein